MHLRALETLVLLLARLALGGLLAFSGWMKLKPGNLPMPGGGTADSGPQLFLNNLRSFEIGMPDHLLVLAAFAVPWTEIVCAAALLFGLWARPAGALAAALLLAFTGGVVSVLLRHMNVNCGCFGDLELLCVGPLGWCKVAENGALIAIALLVAWRGSGGLALLPEGPSVAPPRPRPKPG